MPQYEYRCKKCEKAFIVERPMNDSTSTNCTYCGSVDLARVWNATFVSGKASGTTSGAVAGAEKCATNPSKPKNCCPCG